MIRYTTGNLLEAGTQALVNTVNTVGVMGKGIALQFAERYRTNLKAYKEACKDGSLQVGRLLVVKDADMQGERLIINFPTKKDWKHRSSYAYIEQGLEALVEVIHAQGIRSVALPPLGCGNGGLRWEKVKPLIEAALGALDADIVVYEPSAEIKAVLQQETIREAKLTPGRAMLLYALFVFERLGEPSSLFVANKLAFFLKLLGEQKMRQLEFKPVHYGPYSVGVQHALYDLNGVYLKGLEQHDAKPFEELRLNYERFAEVERYIARELSPEQRARLERLIDLVAGFRSTYALELLSSVAFIMQDERHADIQGIQQRMHDWSKRKGAMADEASVRVAYEHLAAYGNSLAIA
ncbi:MAG TPA: macro domain-containing protein [Flavobacteriales bacterium]